MPEARPTMTREQELERRLVTRGLRLGVLVSGCLLALGLVVWMASGQPVLRAFHAWGREAQLSWQHPAGLLLSAGLLGLLLTPILRVVLLAWIYFRLRDRIFAALALAVLGLLALSAFLGASA